MMASLAAIEPPNSLTRFLETRSALPREARTADRLPYCAWEIGDRDARYLEIRMPFPKMSVCLPYGQLSEINGEWRLGRSIILVFTRSPYPIVVRIDGEDLHDLYDGLRQWKAISIAQFDPVEHLAHSGHNYIKNITLTRGPTKPAANTSPLS